jgi:hypothetical protein
MKLTKTQLREIIREEISKLNKQPKMSTRLRELINKGWVLSEEDDSIVNPETGRTIKVKTALSYPPRHPAHRAVMQARRDKEEEEARTQSQKKGKDVVRDLRKSSKSGIISSQDKTDKILNKLTDPRTGNIDWEAIERMSPKSKEKIDNLARIRVKLYDKLKQKSYDLVDEVDSIQSYDNRPKLERSDADGNRIYKQEETGTEFTRKELDRYDDERRKFEDENDLGDAATAAFNVKWTEENPDKPTISREKLDKVKSSLKKLEDVDNKRRPMRRSYDALKQLLTYDN